MPTLLLSIALLIGFFLLVIRPQRARAVARQKLLQAITVGERVMTTSGLFGVVIAIEDDSVRLSLAPGMSVWLARGAVARRLAASDPGPALADLATTTETTSPHHVSNPTETFPGDGSAVADREDPRP